MKKILLLFMISYLMIPSFSYGASDNHIDRVLSLKSEYKLTPQNNTPHLIIKENSANEFTSQEQRFTINLRNAKWYDDSIDLINSNIISNMPNTIVTIKKRNSSSAKVTITRDSSNLSTKALIKIPLYVETTEGGKALVEIDSDSLISSGQYVFANVLDTSKDYRDVLPHVFKGYTFNKNNATYIKVEENILDEYSNGYVFRLSLENGIWIEEDILSSIIYSDDSIKVQSMKKIDDETIEFKLLKEKNNKISSISIPIICKTIDKGDCIISILSSKHTGDKGKYYFAIVDKEKPVFQMKLQLNKPTAWIETLASKKSIDLNNNPLKINNQIMLPLSDLATHCSYKLQWLEETKQISLVRNNKFLLLTLNSDYALINGTKVQMKSPLIIKNGRTYINAEFLCMFLGYDLKIDGDSISLEFGV